MATIRGSWGSDERVEYAEMMELVVACKNTTERLNLMGRLVNDAIQAQRPWARDLERAAVRAGFAKEIKSYQDRNRALVSHDGQLLNLPSVQDRRVTTPTGEIYHQRELIEVFPWKDIEAKRTEAMKGQSTYDAKIAHYDALLSLRDMAPGSRTPEEAARMLGTTVDQWLGGKKAA